MILDKSDPIKQEEYVLIPTPVDYEQFMKMQYSKDFTNINSLDKNIIPDGLQNKLSSGLIDRNILNNYNQNPVLDILSIANSTAYQGLNKDIYEQINNGVEQKFLIEYANKLSHESKIENPKYTNQYFDPSFVNNENRLKFSKNPSGIDHADSNLDAPFDMKFLEKKSSDSPIKGIKDFTSGNEKNKIRSTKIYENAGRSISEIF